MELSDKKKGEYIKRLLKSRMRILVNNGFYGLLLMHMLFALDEECETAATDGRRIYFSPKFLDEISDTELDFVMMHEILHVVLQHCLRHGDRDAIEFNIACDIVVNSNILLSMGNDRRFITLQKYGESMHLTPEGKEGHQYTAEQVYEMVSKVPPSKNGKSWSSGKDGKGGMGGKDNKGDKGGASDKDNKNNEIENAWDDHSKWGNDDENDILKDMWQKRLVDAYEAIKIQEASRSYGGIPAFAERLLKELKEPQTDWRRILNEFVQEEIVDYSFSPPDRRYDEGPFFLPDFNEKDDYAVDILFMIDTSGSMSDDMITAAYSEVKGAIDQYDGKLKGWLGFFDAEVIEPKFFENAEEFRIIRPKGGGGTDFEVIFDYVKKNMGEKQPVCIIILTDGYGSFGDEEIAMGIPVLWLLNNEEVNPPWGKVARIEI